MEFGHSYYTLYFLFIKKPFSMNKVTVLLLIVGKVSVVSRPPIFTGQRSDLLLAHPQAVCLCGKAYDDTMCLCTMTCPAVK